jgi:hypothetical protein
MSQPKMCHVHGQHGPHGEAKIVMNRDALLALIEKANLLLEPTEGPGKVIEVSINVPNLYAADGEGFELFLVLDDNDWQSDSWQERTIPYRDLIAYSGANRGKDGEDD